MKKEFVSLTLQVVDVQLSDCIAGSEVNVQTGQTIINEIDGSGLGSGDGVVSFDNGNVKSIYSKY